MNSFFKIQCVAFIVMAFSLLAAGCSWFGNNNVQSPNSEHKDPFISVSDHKETADFVLGEGDVIDIAVYRKKTSENILGVGDTFELTVYRRNISEFVLVPGDSINISVYRHDNFSTTVDIDKNGNFVMPLIGEVNAIGKTTSELRTSLINLLDKYIVDPQIQVTIEEKQSFLVSSLSLSFTVSAQKGGNVLFPMIGEVKVVGMRVDELKKLLEEQFSKTILDPVVDISLSQISSLQVDELSVSATVQRNGSIMYPLLGDVHAAGKGVYELRDELERQLSNYLVSPQVTISLSSVQSQQYYVLGEVNSPGIFTMNRRLKPLDAIGQAGGFTLDANQDAVLLIRNVQGEVKARALNMNLKDALVGGYESLIKGDVLYVPPTQIANIERFMSRLSTIISTLIRVEEAIVLGPEVKKAFQGGKESSSEWITID